MRKVPPSRLTSNTSSPVIPAPLDGVRRQAAGNRRRALREGAHAVARLDGEQARQVPEITPRDVVSGSRGARDNEPERARFACFQGRLPTPDALLTAFLEKGDVETAQVGGRHRAVEHLAQRVRQDRASLVQQHALQPPDGLRQRHLPVVRRVPQVPGFAAGARTACPAGYCRP